MNLTYLRLEIVRILRDPKYAALAVVAPIGFYLLFATVFGGAPTQPGQLEPKVEIMVAMAAYGGIWAVLSTTGPRIAEERQSAWFEQLKTMPMTTMQVLVSKLLASVLMALPAIVLVCVTAAVVEGVQLSLAQWVSLVVVLWIGTAAFSTMGIACGYAVGADVAYALSYGIYMAMSAAGGLFVPPTVLPAGMQDAAHALPTFQLADLGWQVALGNTPALPGILVLAAWAAGFAVIAFVAYQRPRLRNRAAAAPRAVDKLAA
jgi:ABC-2 type transport system permease protein